MAGSERSSVRDIRERRSRISHVRQVALTPRATVIQQINHLRVLRVGEYLSQQWESRPVIGFHCEGAGHVRSGSDHVADLETQDHLVVQAALEPRSAEMALR
jgi:hypothetical protein